MNYQLGVIPVFPARVVEGVGIDIQRANGVYTFALDYDSVPVGSVVDPTTAYVLVQQPDGTYAKVPISNALTAALPAQMTGKRNALINGGMYVWQRTVNNVAVTTGRTYVADRWAVKTGAGTLTSVSRVVSATRSPYALLLQGKAGVTTVDVDQRIEAVNVRPLQGMVTFSARIDNTTGASLAPTLFVSTPTVADNWAANSVQNNGGAGDVLQSCPAGVGTQVTWSRNISAYTNITNGLEFRLRFPSGALDTTAKFIGVKEVQVEPVATLGDPPTLFEVETFGDELARCQRYYQKTFPYATQPATNASYEGALSYTQAVGAAASAVGWQWRYQITMRAPAVLTTFNPLANNAQARADTAGADCTATAASAISDAATYLSFTSAAGSVAGTRNLLHVTADAEL